MDWTDLINRIRAQYCNYFACEKACDVQEFKTMQASVKNKQVQQFYNNRVAQSLLNLEDLPIALLFPTFHNFFFFFFCQTMAKLSMLQ